MAKFRIEIPVKLELEVEASNADTALRQIDTAFGHVQPLGGMIAVNLILRRGETGFARFKDAKPIGEAALVEEVEQ